MALEGSGFAFVLALMGTMIPKNASQRAMRHEMGLGLMIEPKQQRRFGAIAEYKSDLKMVGLWSLEVRLAYDIVPRSM